MPDTSARQRMSGSPARQRILETAHDRFLAEGFHRVTMDELAGDLGMSKKTLYRYFPGKRELLNAVLDLRLTTIAGELDAVAADTRLGFTGRLGATLDVLARRLSEVQPPFLRDLQRHAPDSFRRIERFREQRVATHFGQLLAEGRRQGRVRADLDHRIVSEALLRLVQGTVNPDTAIRLGTSLASAFDTVLTLILEGVMTARGRAARRRRPRRLGLVRPARATGLGSYWLRKKRRGTLVPAPASSASTR